MEILQIQHNSPEWLAFRQNGIGASEAAAVLGLSPFKTNVELWEEKVGLRQPKQIESDVIEYGRDAEDLLTQMFALDYPCYNVKVDKTVVYKNDFMFCSLDGELENKKTKEKGILEDKTALVMSAASREKWHEQIPNQYYVQVLHQMAVTGWTYVWVKAQLKSVTGKTEDGIDIVKLETLHVPIFRKDVKEEIDYLISKEAEFWDCVKKKIRPALILPQL